MEGLAVSENFSTYLRRWSRLQWDNRLMQLILGGSERVSSKDLDSSLQSYT